MSEPIVKDAAIDHHDNLRAQLHKASAAHDRLEDLLGNWAAWMMSGGNPEFIVSAHSVGKGFTHYDTEGSYLKLDLANARTVDAIINNDLGIAEKRAIYCEYLDATFAIDGSYQAILALAREEVRIGCIRKGLLG